MRLLAEPTPQPSEQDDAPTLISAFSGGGGLDLGLEIAGFRTLAAIEVDNWSCWTLRANQGARYRLPNGRRYLEDAEVIENDIRSVTGKSLLDRLGLRPGELSVFAGGPPCVSFSVAGAREGMLSDSGKLFNSYARLLRVLKPSAFVFENVKGLLSAPGPDGEPGGAWPFVTATLEAAGYRLSTAVLNAADFGVPQVRERVIIIGLRGRRGPKFEFPDPTHSQFPQADLLPWLNVSDALAGLPKAALPGEDPVIQNHVSRAHSAAVKDSFAATHPGQRNPKFKRDRLRWDRPAKVVRAQGKLKPGGGGARHSSHQAIHPAEPRQLTVRECARIQSFPDWYVLPSTHCNGYRVVGEAVPPLLAAVIGRSLQEQRFLRNLKETVLVTAGSS